MIRRRLGILATAGMLMGLSIVSVPPVDAASHGVVCYSMTLSQNWPAPPTHGTTASLKGLVCTDYVKAWTTPGNPNSCVVSIPGVPGLTDVNGVCGYYGNQTSTFHFRINFTMSNIAGLVYSFALPGVLATVPLPSGTKRDCDADWAFTPSSVSGSHTFAWASGYCGPLYPY